MSNWWEGKSIRQRWAIWFLALLLSPIIFILMIINTIKLYLIDLRRLDRLQMEGGEKDEKEENGRTLGSGSSAGVAG